MNTFLILTFLFESGSSDNLLEELEPRVSRPLTKSQLLQKVQNDPDFTTDVSEEFARFDTKH